MKSVLYALTTLAILLSGAQSAEKLARHGSFIDKFVLQNTINPLYEGYIVIVLARSEHKIVYQRSPIDHTTFVDSCNQADPQDSTCSVYDPGPVYEEWDLATQVEDGTLTPANRRKWLWAWVYEVHVAEAVKDVEDWLVSLSGLGAAAQRRVYSGALQAWGIDPIFADACALQTLPNGGGGVQCTYSETGLVHITGRIKRLVEDLDDAVLDLP